MNRRSKFSYACHACGRCCHDKVITLSPHDVLTMARAAEISTTEAIARFTIRRGSVLRFDHNGACSALDGTRCGLHSGRPLACRIYPLGIERGDAETDDRFVRLKAAPGSAGVYGTDGSVADFLKEQGVHDCLAMNDRYLPLLAALRRRVDELLDFEKVEPREFWRCAAREALAESGYDSNAIIDALFDPDSIPGTGQSIDETVQSHVARLRELVHESHDGPALAAAAVLLAVSLGYSPSILT
jgi:Fe-S-cluster containining protein